jgi:AAA+ superfamily predicted ATPase
METIKTKVLRSLEQVHDSAKKCELKVSIFETLESELHVLSNYFGISKKQSFFLAQIFALNYKDRLVDIKDLIEYLDCNPIKILEYSDEILFLLSSNIIKKEKSRHRVNVSLMNDQFSINEAITEAILKNETMPQLCSKNKNSENIIDVLEKFYYIGQLCDDKIISSDDLISQSHEIIDKNIHLPLIKYVDDLEMSIIDKYIYFYMIWKTVNGKERVFISVTTEAVFETASERVLYQQQLLDKENFLIEQNLLELVEASFFGETELKLSDKSNTILKELGLSILSQRKKNKNIIEPSTIQYKKLFYGETEKNQINMLSSILNETKLTEVQNRLLERKLPRGITILLYGAPGTGKTETALQIAKETNREIYKVDISESKTAWFGESERLVKKIFTDYKEFAKRCEQTPILLFNEADAIISKRKDSSSSGVAQTENTIQNIILEELESFEGIFFATTNLADNFDAAFDRRFLFKIELQKPDVSIKAKIWQSKLQNVVSSDCEHLAKSFDFSGGQIENIVRKNEMHEIITGEKANIAKLLEFCNAEQFHKTTRIKIGFQNN